MHTCDELGILLDVSHLTAAGFWDVLDETRGAVVATHSNAWAVCPHSRNLDDRQLAERLGVHGVALGSDFDGARIPDAIGDAAGLKALLGALRQTGWRTDAVRAFAHRTWLRVWGEVTA